MPHIHTLPGQYDHTASAFIYRTTFGSDGEKKVELLLHMHKKFNRILQPGGHIELNESPWDAINHELVEETGYIFNQLKILQPPIRRLPELSNPASKLHPIPFVHKSHEIQENHNHTDIAYLFVTNEEPKQTPGEGESTDIRWVTLEQLEDYDFTEISSGAREVGRYGFQILADGDWTEHATNEFE